MLQIVLVMVSVTLAITTLVVSMMVETVVFLKLILETALILVESDSSSMVDQIVSNFYNPEEINRDMGSLYIQYIESVVWFAFKVVVSKLCLYVTFRSRSLWLSS